MQVKFDVAGVDLAEARTGGRKQKNIAISQFYTVIK
jgi:hypothetical protein